MRFFSHDGKTVHGPSSAAELSALPGFDGDTLVCPVGSEDSADWKPALSYPPFREILLAPAPKPAPLPPPPPPPAPTAPCPRCSARNPERARYCNECGARMDGTAEAPPPAPAPLEAPAPVPPPPAPAPMSRPPMGRPGGMMGRIEEASPGLAPIPLPEPPPPVALPAAAAPAAAPSSDAASLRKTLIAAFLGASLASGGLGYYLLRPRAKVPKVPAGTEITLTPPAAPTPAPAPVAAPVAPAPAPVPAPAAPEAARPAPAAEEERPAPPPKRIARKPKRAKTKAAPVPVPKPEPSPAPAGDSGESLIESRVNALEGAAAEPKAAAAAEPKPAPLAPPSGGESPSSLPQIGQAPAAAPASPAAASDGGLMLPGLPRRVGPKSVTKPKADAKAPPPSKPSEAPAPSVPEAAGAAAAAAPTGVSSAPAAAPGQDGTAAPEDPTLRQVREQFEFCAQLLAQGAYDDHFDTCLCAETRGGAPYRGRRGLYASSMKKSAAAGKLESSATIAAIALDGASAKVTAQWKSSAADRGRSVVERWRLEDGLWCRAP